MLADGTQFTGADLEARLERLMTFQKYLQIVERRGPTRDMVLELLERNGRDKAFFADADEMRAMADALSSPLRTVSVQPDEEHQAHSLVIEDRSTGYPRYHRVDLDFVTTGEFRALAHSYQDVKGHPRPDDRSGRRAPPRQAVEEEAGAAADEQRHRRRATRRGDQARRGGEDPRRQLDAESRTRAPQGRGACGSKNLDELVEYFIAAGKKGYDINRYKGLGEMNPDTLWETTMDPAKRTLLQVKAEDHPQADLMFTTLMGDQVEPRRKFIEDNALDVKNLDI